MSHVNDSYQRRRVTQASLAVCANGHVVGLTGKPLREAYQVRHSCGEWTWEEGNYCVKCGGRLRD